MPTLPFLHPAVFLTGLGAVSVPILIHILNRRRFRLMDWAAMQFLLESVRRNRRRLRIEELILLALRCLVLLVLAIALARFTGCRAMTVLPGGAESQTAVFVLDDSYSMGQRVGAGTILSAAMMDMMAEIERLSEGDQVAILLTSSGDRDEPFLAPTVNPEKDPLMARLRGLTPSDRRAQWSETLSAAARVFESDKSITRRLYVYSDFRQVDLASTDESGSLRKEFDELRKLEVEVVAMDFGRDATTNLTIESMELVDKYAVAKVAARIRVEVRNRGDQPAKDVEVQLRARFVAPEGIQSVELPTGVIPRIERRSTAPLEFEFRCPHAGAAALTAELPADELPGDNSAHLAIDVRDAIKVLAVDGRLDLSDPAESESFFLLYSLDPDRNGSAGAKVEVISPTSLPETPLADQDLVALLNVGELPISLDGNGTATWPQVEALTEYVREGGGLVIFTGDRVNPTFYNGPMYAEGSGLSPFRLGPRRGDPSKREAFYRLDPRSIAAHESTAVFRSYLAAGIDPTRFIRFYALTGTNPVAAPPSRPDVKAPRVLARFADEDNSAAIVSRQIGAGTVMVFYSTASMRWNDWPADENGTYVAVLHDMLRSLARRRGRSLWGLVGEPIAYRLPEGLRDATASLKTPRHPQDPLVPLVPVRPSTAAVAAGKTPRPSLRYDRADHAGGYELELALPDGTKRQVLFTRTADPAEGDLTPGRQPAVAAAFGGEQFEYFDRTESGTSDAVDVEQKQEYWTWALAILAVLLAAETFLGQRFGHYPAAEEKKRPGR